MVWFFRFGFPRGAWFECSPVGLGRFTGVCVDLTLNVGGGVWLILWGCLFAG